MICGCTLNKFIMSGVREVAEMRNQLRKLQKQMKYLIEDVEDLKKSDEAQTKEIEELKHIMGYNTEEEEPVQSKAELDVTTTCQGCLTNQPNQLAHMEEGGCLA